MTEKDEFYEPKKFTVEKREKLTVSISDKIIKYIKTSAEMSKCKVSDVTEELLKLGIYTYNFVSEFAKSYPEITHMEVIDIIAQLLNSGKKSYIRSLKKRQKDMRSDSLKESEGVRGKILKEVKDEQGTIN